MLNAEKYKKDIEKANYCFAIVNNEFINCFKLQTCTDCKFDKTLNCGRERFKWLLQEYKESILTDEEKIIIKNILKAFEPFGKELSYITKDRWNCDESCFLNFKYGNDSFGTLTFNSGKLFKGMEINKRYTLRGLDL